MADLRGARARAVLIGTGCATGGAGADGLDEVPAVRTTITDLAAVLVERCGMAAANVREVHDPAQPFLFGQALAEETAAAEDALLIYFCGHGRAEPRRGRGRALTEDIAGVRREPGTIEEPRE
ncbi:hypothetical protein AB0F15_08880 [Amycolatopsis sp. NPDC026612]|uniref:hypothetical protein n=1 Tax=Amycolatopsis sp. NPDC026612 TaxID=3155466 RepID=UPI0033FF71A8